MVELRRLRLEVAQISLQSSHESHVTCSSLFIEPVEWMGPLIIGRKDGKVREIEKWEDIIIAKSLEIYFLIAIAHFAGFF